jgi:hypothetical protein
MPDGDRLAKIGHFGYMFPFLWLTPIVHCSRSIPIDRNDPNRTLFHLLAVDVVGVRMWHVGGWGWRANVGRERVRDIAPGQRITTNLPTTRGNLPSSGSTLYR